MNDFEERQRRLDRARLLIRAELVVAIAAPVIVAVLYLAAPGNMGPPMFSEPPWFAPLFPWAGIVGVTVGLVWTVRLSRLDPEAGDRTWRYRDLSDLERRRRRGSRARISRVGLVILAGTPLVAGLLWVLAPGSFRAMLLHWSLVAQLLPWAGIVGAIVGLAWVLYISRDDPEAGDRTWRYRDF